MIPGMQQNPLRTKLEQAVNKADTDRSGALSDIELTILGVDIMRADFNIQDPQSNLTPGFIPQGPDILPGFRKR